MVSILKHPTSKGVWLRACSQLHEIKPFGFPHNQQVTPSEVGCLSCIIILKILSKQEMNALLEYFRNLDCFIRVY